MKNSTIKENILIQTAEYKRDKQNSILKRYYFKSKKEGEENTPLPYTLISRKVSSRFFKRNIHQQVKIAILNADLIGINVNDIVYKFKQHRISEMTSQKYIDDHYPFDTKMTVEIFHSITNAFINVYQVLPEGLKKIDPLVRYVHGWKTVGLDITILSTNCITIEFYDDGKASDYVVEVMNCVSNYEQLSYKNYTSSILADNMITYVDGLLVHPKEIKETSSKIEVYTLDDKTVLYNDEVEINNGEFKFNDSLGIINPNLVFPYAYKSYDDGNTQMKYEQYFNSVSLYSDNIPNKYKLSNYNSNKVYMLVLGQEDVSTESTTTSLYDVLLNCYDNNSDYVDEVMTHTLSNVDSDTQLLLKYPYLYKDILEKISKDDLYIKTIYSIKRQQLALVNYELYIKFTFPIKSFSFMIFMNGKIVHPDRYEEDNLDATIYIKVDRVMTLNESYVYRKALADYTHKELQQYTHDQLMNKGYIYGDAELPLDVPLTIVRTKNFFSESNRYPIIASPLYVSKNKYHRYSYNVSENRYMNDDNGRYIYYNDRYYMISNYEYIYGNNKFVKVDNRDGDYYKLIANRFKIPYNKNLEKNLHDLIFVEEYNDKEGKVIEGVVFDEVQVNSNYPYPIPDKSNKYYNRVIRAHCNDFLTMDSGGVTTVSERMVYNSGYPSYDEYEEYDILISTAYAKIQNSNINSTLLNSIINIAIDDKYVYFITDLSYIYLNYKNVYCKAIQYTLGSDTVSIVNVVDTSNIRYLKYDLYTEENELILRKTDDRIYVDGGNVSNDYEILINNALNAIEIDMDYDNIAIENNKIYFFKNEFENVTEDSFSTSCHVYDLVENKVLSNPTDSSVPFMVDIAYENIEYLHNNIYDGNKILFRRKGYPRLYNKDSSISVYNADIGYSKYYTSSGDWDDVFDIPQPLQYNYDQLMLFANGYHINDFLMNGDVHLFDHIQTRKNDIFICNMSKMILYQSTEDLTVYSNMTIQLSDTLSVALNEDTNFSKKYEKNINIAHCPLSLKYMMIFVNGVYIDEQHIEILSNKCFMLKNLDDLPMMSRNEKNLYIINDVKIYVYPFMFDGTYIDYYKYSIAHMDERQNKKYDEYLLNDTLYDLYMSELVSTGKQYCDRVLIEKAKNKKYFMSDFRHYSLNKFTQDELDDMIYDKEDYDKFSPYLSSYTHEELSEYTHKDLEYYIHGESEEVENIDG